jgi:hypothetical protein
MNFLTPLFLIGGVAIAAPIIYHLIRRTTREKTIFSSLMFLLPSPPRLSKRHKLEHLLLLILRCLALLLLAFAFARPFLRQPALNDPTSTQPKRMVVLVDVSASMRRDGLWTAAKEKVDAILRAAGPSDHVALITFDRGTTTLLPFDEWNRATSGDRVALATSRLAAVNPGWAGTHLGNALITAAEALAEADGKASTGPRQVVLVSDLQVGSRLDTLQAYEWPKGVELVVEPVKARNPTNAGLQLVADPTDANRPADVGAVVRVRVTNSADAKREQFKVGWAQANATNDFIGTPIDIYVPPSQSRVVAVPVPKGATVSDRITLRGDDEAFDNTVYVIPPTQLKLGVLWLGSESPDDTKQPLFFLQRALSNTPRIAVNVVARPAAATLLPTDLEAANLIFVTEAIPASTATALREHAQAGKVIVFAPKNAEAGAALRAITGREDVRVTEAKPSNYAMFADIDFQHPLFAPFADPRFSDFTKIHIWRYRKIEATTIPDLRVIAKFDSGDPALFEAPLGKGKLVALATGWQPEDSQIAVSTKFVPLLWSLLEMTGGVTTMPTQFFVGDTVAAPAEKGATFTVSAPDGKSAPLAANATNFTATLAPGIYMFAGGAKPQRFAVNVEANESRTMPIGADELETVGLPVKAPKVQVVTRPAEQALLQAAEAENRQKLWRWFVAATLAVLLAESALAGWTARRATAQIEEVPS